MFGVGQYLCGLEVPWVSADERNQIQIPLAVDKNGCAKVCRQLLGNLRNIEADPGDWNLPAEWRAGISLWARMNATDKAMVGWDLQ